MSELLPCPFCLASGTPTINSYGKLGVQLFCAECAKCGVSLSLRETESEAVTAWNTRGDHPVADASPAVGGAVPEGYDAGRWNEMERLLAAKHTAAPTAQRAMSGEPEHWSAKNPGAADQYRAESKAARKALGFDPESDSVSPSDLSDGVEALRGKAIATVLALLEAKYSPLVMDGQYEKAEELESAIAILKSLSASELGKPRNSTAELLAAAKNFYNLTIADSTVVIRPHSAEKQKSIIDAGERLRSAMLAHVDTQPLASESGKLSAFEQGKAARVKGLGTSDNPYLGDESPAPCELAYQWQHGYEAAIAESRTSESGPSGQGECEYCKAVANLELADGVPDSNLYVLRFKSRTAGESFLTTNVPTKMQHKYLLASDVEAEVAVLRSQIAGMEKDAARYREISTPEIKDFIVAIERESLHQRDRWGADHDAGKADSDWFWLIGFLAGKALSKPEKQLHHIITTAAACLNWHAARLGAYNGMRPGIAGESVIMAPKQNHDAALAPTSTQASPPSDQVAGDIAQPDVFAAALRETYQMVDAFKPPPAGSYSRGSHDGVIAALKTIKENYDRLSIAPVERLPASVDSAHTSTQGASDE